MKLSIVLVLTLLVACKTDDEQPPVNRACAVAKRMALPSLECDPQGTNLGWLPDTCVCQLAATSADATGKWIRVPTQVIWVKASLLEPPEIKSVYKIDPPVPAPAQTKPPHKE
jgi:hypothetical protein